MQIEENFRDNKSVRYGLGLAHAKSKIRERHVVMLLLAALATLVAYLIGAAGGVCQQSCRLIF
jgi:formylmethanofuran dehydrogenase subunit B